MNKLVYVGIVVVIVLVVGAVLLVGKGGTSNQQTTQGSVQTSQQSSYVTTAGSYNTTTANNTGMTTVVNPYNTTTSIPPSNSSVNSTVQGCKPTSGYYICTNASYSVNANKTADIVLTVGQNTGTSWSSFGVGFAPPGTILSGGVPQIPFYTSNITSTSNVGASLNSSASTKILIPVNDTGSKLVGTIWVCYLNSGLLYVGSAGCVQNAGGSGVATYVAIGTVNLTAV